jgi:hypothetical protein
MAAKRRKRGAWDPTWRAWWTPRRPWPGSMHFEDGETERVLDRMLPLPELPAGTYVSTGELCIESQFAEGEYDDRVGI